MGVKIKIKDVRLSFPTLFTPKAQVGDDGKPGTPKYSCSGLFPREHAATKAISDAIKEVAKEKWPTTWEKILGGLKGQDRLCLHNGDYKEYGGYAGNLYVGTSSTALPDCRDIDGSRLNASQAGRLYGGCYVDMVISIWPQDHVKYGKRVNAEILGVQFRRDGDAFRAGEAAKDEDFEDLSSEDGGGGGNAERMDEDDSLV